MAVIQFENGQKVEFDGDPTPEDVEEVAAKLGIKSAAPAPSRASSVIKTIQDLPEKTTAPLRGAVKSAGRTLLGIPAIGEKISSAAAKLATGGKEIPGFTDGGPATTVREKLEPQGAGEKAGAFVEQAAELFLPVPGAAKAKVAAEVVEKIPMLARAAQAFKTAAISALELGGKTAVQTGGDLPETAAGAAVGLTAPLASMVFKTPLTMMAEKLYASAAKFTTSATEKAAGKGIDLVKTGLRERVFLTQGGVERVAAKIDDMENQVGKAIEEAKKLGAKISTAGLKGYLDEAKELFKYDVDVAAGKAAIKELDDIGRAFVKEHGRFLPIELAQKIKVRTGQQLAKYYDRLSSVGIEGRKQATRFLKEKIIEKAPTIGDINKRLASLYELDKALDSSMNRIKKLNLLGLGTKILTAGGRGEAAVALQVLGSAFSKSGAAIGLNELAKLAEGSAQAGKIPAALLLRYLASLLTDEQGSQERPQR